MSTVFEIKKLSVKRSFSPTDSHYEVSVHFSCPDGQYDGTMTWILTELQLVDGGVVSKDAYRKGSVARFSLSITSEGNRLLVIDDSEHHFVGQSVVLDNFFKSLLKV